MGRALNYPFLMGLTWLHYSSQKTGGTNPQGFPLPPCEFLPHKGYKGTHHQGQRIKTSIWSLKGSLLGLL